VSRSSSSPISIPDEQLFSLFLPSGHRSALWQLSPALQGVFLYTGVECVRVEFPSYLAIDQKALERILCAVMDQVHKGMGYPLCLAEAHMQAIIREPDRQFVIAQFHAQVREYRSAQGTIFSPQIVSQKLARKRHLPM